jgi:hypothetical protein
MHNIPRTLLFYIALLNAICPHAWSKTVTAGGGSNSQVQSAIDSATDGDTVVIPPGNYDWSGGISCGKAVTISGTGVTVNHRAGGGDLVRLTTSSRGHVTLNGINFQPGNGTGRYLVVEQGANGVPFIMGGVTFEIPNWQLNEAMTVDATGGLIYNCTFASHADGGSGGPGAGSGCCQIRSSKSWYDKSTLGALDTNGDANTYFEDCTFLNIYNQAVDVDEAGRVVIRHCSVTNTQFLTHGITGMWGGRQVELYNNQFKYVKQPPNSANIPWVALSRWLWMRAGTGRIHDNTVDALDSGGYWGSGHVSWVFIDEPLTRPGAGNGGVCESESQYPGTRWPGTGSDGTQYPTGRVVSPSLVDPVYVWNNTGAGASTWGVNDQTGYGCDNNGHTANVFKLGRDIIFSAAPGYATYTYPHPWRGGAGPTPTPTATPGPTATPNPTASPTPTATPTPTPNPTPTPAPTPPPSADYSAWLNQLAGWIHDHPATPGTAHVFEEGTQPVAGKQ